jgi:hypothetical protein
MWRLVTKDKGVFVVTFAGTPEDVLKEYDKVRSGSKHRYFIKNDKGSTFDAKTLRFILSRCDNPIYSNSDEYDGMSLSYFMEPTMKLLEMYSKGMITINTFVIDFLEQVTEENVKLIDELPERIKEEVINSAYEFDREDFRTFRWETWIPPRDPVKAKEASERREREKKERDKRVVYGSKIVKEHYGHRTVNRDVQEDEGGVQTSS